MNQMIIMKRIFLPFSALILMVSCANDRPQYGQFTSLPTLKDPELSYLYAAPACVTTQVGIREFAAVNLPDEIDPFRIIFGVYALDKAELAGAVRSSGKVKIEILSFPQRKLLGAVFSDYQFSGVGTKRIGQASPRKDFVLRVSIVERFSKDYSFQIRYSGFRLLHLGQD